MMPIKEIMIDGNCDCGMPRIWIMRSSNWKWIELTHSCIAYLRWKIAAITEDKPND